MNEYTSLQEILPHNWSIDTHQVDMLITMYLEKAALTDTDRLYVINLAISRHGGIVVNALVELLYNK